jgi:hypothetical protein
MALRRLFMYEYVSNAQRKKQGCGFQERKSAGRKKAILSRERCDSDRGLRCEQPPLILARWELRAAVVRESEERFLRSVPARHRPA